ncbi:MAG: TlpA family protein disulfide reductase [Rickettsiales bacterium TMED289]|nr:MAG: TlpA family protein disulfide reductase [Rickettsiales bacterium TMED289]|tara:strand:+ start:1477 stop:2106 length:630 start_codon:yes stop_codon:yes gene_type:complete
MHVKKLQILIILMAIIIAFLGFKNIDISNDLEKYKKNYKDLAIMYLNEVMDSPLLEPYIKNGEIASIDFDLNVLQFSDLNNNIFSIQNFEGKTLFINYWATWCNPCLAEMPSMADLYDRYKNNENIVFLYLSKEDLNTIIDYLPKDESLQKLPIYKIITDDEFFATTGIPTTFIINSTGDVVVKDVGSAFWNDDSVFNFIDNLLGKDEV